MRKLRNASINTKCSEENLKPLRNPLNDTKKSLKSSEIWGTEISRKCFI
jgi:hypothetical protein